MSVFINALLGGVLLAVGLLLLWRLAQRIGLALPRARPARRLLCVQPVELPAADTDA
ncbi:hypothetical protein ACPOLB_13275 [Rubrivivax sp. RP6-9]|uniref:hypothetical protein n=1 Tax=Rubrivivax sp. RP6-9 TaxID=3415750 RepID=UPI003CC55200